MNEKPNVKDMDLPNLLSEGLVEVMRNIIVDAPNGQRLLAIHRELVDRMDSDTICYSCREKARNESQIPS